MTIHSKDERYLRARLVSAQLREKELVKLNRMLTSTLILFIILAAVSAIGYVVVSRKLDSCQVLMS